jgi:hypothetical protein
MTINLADNSPRISYAVAQGATQTSFAVPFEFFASADLNVYVDGTLKSLTTHYTVSGGDGSTGTVTISVTGATGGSTVVITRDVALERTTDFPSSGPFQIGALNTELDRLTAIAADLDDKAGRALQLTDFDVAASLVLPTVDNRKGKTLAFNASSGAVEAGPTISDVQTVSAAAADIQTLAHIEDGTDATDAIQTVAGIASNVSTVAGVSSAVSTVAGISSNVTAVAADATDIGVVAGKATEIGRLGTADAVSDLNTLGTADAVSDMNTLAAISANISTVAGISANVTSVAGVASLITSDFVADLNTLATTDIVSDLNTLATADIVSDLNTLATSDIVSDLNTLATADIVSDLNTLATTDIVSDLNTLATTDIVTDLNLLATSAIVEDLNLLATSTVIADMATLAGAGANPNISSLGVSGNITLADNGKAIFGAGSDLQIYHDGSSGHSIITESGSGALQIQGENLVLEKPDGTNYLLAVSGASGYVKLYQNGSEKLATTSTGVDITGTLTSDGLTVDNATVGDLITVTGANGTDLRIGNHASANGGIYINSQAASDDLRFRTQGSDRMTITSAGSVGIGTTSPYTLLELSSIDPILRFNDSNGGTDTKNFELRYVGTSSPDIDGLYFRTVNDANAVYSDKMVILGSGNVGIGTSSPNRNLVVNSGSSSGYIQLANTNSGTGSSNGLEIKLDSGGVEADIINRENGRIGFWTNNTERMRIDSGGKVGIGSASDGAILQLDKASSSYFDIQSDSTLRTRIYNDSSQTILETTTNNLIFKSASSEAMRLDASRNLLVGTTDNQPWDNSGTSTGAVLRSDGLISSATNGQSAIELNRLSSDGNIANFRRSGTLVGSIGTKARTSAGRIFVGNSNTRLLFDNGVDAIIPANNDGNDRDNAIDLGASGARFDDIYATNGTIQTSDRNEKQDIAELTDAEQRVAVAAKGLLRKFRWRDAVTERGDEARTHFGIIAQDLQAAFAAEGLDAGDYAMFISSTWTDEETGEERTRMGVRYSELLAFIIAAI